VPRRPGGQIDVLVASLGTTGGWRAAAAELAASAFERIDANRTARLELLAVIGDAARPWVGVTTVEPESADGAREAGLLVAAGVDVVRVDVPASRELADRLHDAGFELLPWRARAGTGPGDSEPAPAGSQRGLAEVRLALDEAAAERRGYARLATAALPLAGPEQAVVAAFERVDIVDGDPIAEVVDGNVDPDRALADHAFAHRLIARSGSIVVLGAGPLVVAPDLARGAPSGPATLAGRALALELLGAALARRDGIPPGRILVGAIPPWLIEERNSASLAIAQVLLRRAALPGHPLVFEEPEDGTAAIRWRAILGAALPLVERDGLVVRRASAATAGQIVAETRAVADAAADVAGAYGPIDPRGDNRAWMALLASAGVRVARLHDARHTAATLLCQQGVPIRVVMEILGHSQVSLTMRYTHVLPDMMREAAAGMGEALWG